MNTCILIVSEVKPCHSTVCRVYQVVSPMLDAPGKQLFIYFVTATSFPPNVLKRNMTSLKEYINITEEKTHQQKSLWEVLIWEHATSSVLQLILLNRILININHVYDSQNIYKFIMGSRPTLLCLLFIPRSDLQNGEDNYINETKPINSFT